MAQIKNFSTKKNKHLVKVAVHRTAKGQHAHAGTFDTESRTWVYQNRRLLPSYVVRAVEQAY